MASETGFTANNEMDDSAHRPPVPTPLAACSLLSAVGQCSQAKEPQISRYGSCSCVIETNLPFCFPFSEPMIVASFPVLFYPQYTFSSIKTY